MSTKTIGCIAPHTPVFFMKENKVNHGRVTQVAIIVDSSNETITYTIEEDKQQHWEKPDLVLVTSEFVGMTREELIAKI